MVSSKILVVYPEDHNTYVAVYLGTEVIFLKNIKHAEESLLGFEKVSDQYTFRKEEILRVLKENEIQMSKVEIIMARSGLVKPLMSGVYEINAKMLDDLVNSPLGDHATNLGGIIAFHLAQEYQIKAFIADPIVVDEME